MRKKAKRSLSETSAARVGKRSKTTRASNKQIMAMLAGQRAHIAALESTDEWMGKRIKSVVAHEDMVKAAALIKSAHDEITRLHDYNQAIVARLNSVENRLSLLEENISDLNKHVQIIDDELDTKKPDQTLVELIDNLRRKLVQ